MKNSTLCATVVAIAFGLSPALFANEGHHEGHHGHGHHHGHHHHHEHGMTSSPGTNDNNPSISSGGSNNTNPNDPGGIGGTPGPNAAPID